MTFSGVASLSMLALTNVALHKCQVIVYAKQPDVFLIIVNLLLSSYDFLILVLLVKHIL